MRRTSVAFPDSLVKEIDDVRHSTVSRSDWMRRAVEMRLAADKLENESVGALPDEWWIEAFEEYLDEQSADKQNPVDIEA